MKIHPVVNVSDISLFVPSSIPGQKALLLDPVIVKEEESYKVENILNSKLVRGKVHYLVKWEGYSDKHNSWEPESNVLPGAERLVERFHTIHLNAP